MLRIILSTLIIGLLSLPAMANSLEHLESMIQPQQVEEDLTAWLEWLDKTHPDLSYTLGDVDGFYQNIESLKKDIKEPISIRQLWRKLTVLNSQLSDGHTGIVFDSTRKLTQQHLENGGGIFPFALVFDDSKLVITDKVDGKPSKLKGYSIKKINGMAIEQVLQPLLARMHGDSLRHRKALLAKRFASYYWLYFGNEKEFVIDVVNPKGKININNVEVAASQAPLSMDKVFEHSYQFDILDADTAKLVIKKFNWPNRERYFTFMESAFKQMKERKIKKLIIDIRENGGGDDDMWKEGIVKYIATQPWRHGSTYKVKIIEGRQSEENKLGEVVAGELEANNQVVLDNPYRFEGEVYVLIGAYTYSSSILFANTVQDHGFATLVGEATGGKSGQTGGLQEFTLPNSQLVVFAPRFLLARPKGGQHKEAVQPDIKLSYDKVEPEQLVEQLMTRW